MACRIVFWFPTSECPRTSTAFSYTALHQGTSGYSGTETALLEVAHALATDTKFKVTVVVENASQQYADSGIDFLPALPSNQQIDIFCPLFWCVPDDVMAKVPRSAVIWLWYHCVMSPLYANLFLDDGRPVVASFVSHFVARHCDNPRFQSGAIVGNGVSPRHLLEMDPKTKTPGSWIFHATFERGGAVAERVFEYVRSKNPAAATAFNKVSYYAPDSLDSLPKKELCDLLTKTDYFVYPLVLPDGMVHHDTFACCILEALARGVIVITWNVACIPEIYKNAVVALDPAHVQGYDPSAGYSFNSWCLSDEAVTKLGETVLRIDADPGHKAALQRQGADWVRAHEHIFAWNSVGQAYRYWLSQGVKTLRSHLSELSSKDVLPKAHTRFLRHMRTGLGFKPGVVYDIGCCVLHWTKQAQKVWPEAEYVVFDAFEEASFLYGELQNHVGVLSDSEGKEVKFYQNEYLPGGNSYYREIGGVSGDHFPSHKFVTKRTRMLDSVVGAKGFPLPDLIKIDVQGCELDILRGAQDTLRHATYLIVELQHTQYNEGAPLAPESIAFIESLGWRCIAPKFCDNGADGDYCFLNLKKIGGAV